MKPSVGRIVHFQPFPDAPCQAAIVAMTDPLERGQLQLVVFECESHAFNYLSAVTFQHDVPERGPSKARSWHWPERVDEEGR